MIKKKLLYLMDIDWYWIKQRPQFIAEELNKYYDVTVVYKQNNRKILLQKTGNDLVEDVRVFKSIPFINRNRTLRKINDKRYIKTIKGIVDEIQPDIVYLTDPNQSIIIEHLEKYKVVYDCMDDHIALSGGKTPGEVITQEKAILSKSFFVLCTSHSLCKKILNRYPNVCPRMIHLVRNGYRHFFSLDIESRESNGPVFIAMYFGTISRWFNFEYLKRSINEIPNIEYHLYGPIDGVTIPQNDRIIYKGIAEHSDIPKLATKASALIMPFIVNEIIESVDPVKLYEYIELSKNIICVEYDEIERFENFVYFYQDYDSFVARLKFIESNHYLKYTEDMRNSFLADNTWEKRGEQIHSIIEEGE